MMKPRLRNSLAPLAAAASIGTAGVACAQTTVLLNLCSFARRGDCCHTAYCI